MCVSQECQPIKSGYSELRQISSNTISYYDAVISRIKELMMNSKILYCTIVK